MKDIAQNKEKMGKTTIVSVLLLVVIHSTLIGCVTTAGKKSFLLS